MTAPATDQTGIEFAITHPLAQGALTTSDAAEAADLFDAFNHGSSTRPVITGPFGQEIAPWFARALAGASIEELTEMHADTVTRHRNATNSSVRATLAADAKTIAAVLRARRVPPLTTTRPGHPAGAPSPRKAAPMRHSAVPRSIPPRRTFLPKGYRPHHDAIAHQTRLYFCDYCEFLSDLEEARQAFAALPPAARIACRWADAVHRIRSVQAEHAALLASPPF